MPNFVMLANFTDQGVRTAKETTKRYEAFKEMAAKSGVTVHSLFWTLGQYDVVTIAEADDDIAATALTFSVAAMGNIKTQTLRAFDAGDMAKITAKMA